MAKILLIEDDEILQAMYRKQLQSAGHQVTTAHDGRTGLDLAQSHHPDLVLLDVMLPGGLNGFDVLEQLKNDPKTKDIAVLILTNLETEEKVAKQIGASGYLVKVKTRPDDVIAKVTELLSKV
ncbi:MAG: putative response regulator, atypical CheY [Candidatus Amesbacteria bacterium GW2011_GWA1_47_16]|uniref:Response regulatory domain-containing protein n=5 Tax=Candidatus Amesiibacteriota TaxID=1752730 RepID=A0A1F4ZW91_9BACT|nr:MAG: putative response regulator, atypical CheY [Candidatus Amesbacteria bacterium GW2011_GWC1_47_15]KKU64416.1 MAG: putative response regulator, atypical CheY [Candidatus Amesbacteria bacterium GW2011_GWA1_47_16]KKU97478.1 MAG: putative response regulator, atypical CheY [Candidatus Amesbacteria bacterium GW2011_GWB1_48_13]OGC98127.1 MAG: hypothetical protein A2701_01740 [Candidatus Amesbacteria bacterium RIFCSPHIGHO2_01_FULL_47_34]OGD01850.1 MAG: hypothetical protein A2972_05160 [Candidatus